MSVLSSFVWSVADTLRGPYAEAEYGSVILPFTVLRRLECVMAPHREVMAEVVAQHAGEQQRRTHLKMGTRSADSAGVSFWTTSDFTLKKALQDPDNLAENLIDYVGGFSANLDVFKSFDFESVIRTLDARNRLAQVVRHFERIDLSPDAVSNADMGDLFENLIYRFAESANNGPASSTPLATSSASWSTCCMPRTPRRCGTAAPSGRSTTRPSAQAACSPSPTSTFTV